MRFQLTESNYYTQEANKAYWSASFVKGMLECPARTLAELRGEWKRPDSAALLLGSYIDAWFSGKDVFEQFVEEHPQILNARTGELKAEFRLADTMIRRAEADPVFMEYLRGDKQIIRTGVIDGIPFKGKFDVYLPGERIVDLKTVKDMEPMYRPEQGRISFAAYWNWPMQMAIYQHLEGDSLPCYLAVITKEDPPDIAVISISQEVLDTEMELLRAQLPHMEAMRLGVLEPERCGKCAWCRATKKLTAPVSLDDLF